MGTRLSAVMNSFSECGRAASGFLPLSERRKPVDLVLEDADEPLVFKFVDAEAAGLIAFCSEYGIPSGWPDEGRHAERLIDIQEVL